MREGPTLPSIALPSTKGSAVDLSCIEGRALLILYPWTGRDGVPNPPGWDDIEGAHGSTPELEGFQKTVKDFADLGIALFGLSRQDNEWQEEVSDRLGLTFPLLSDAKDRVWPEIGASTFETGGEIYLKRATLLLSDGCIEKVFDDIPVPAAHAEDLLQRLGGAA